MPPKKAQQKAKAKIVEDKTFGLKNKNKSKKVQQYVRAVETSASAAGISAQARREAERAAAARANSKAMKEAAAMEQAALFRTVVNKTVVPQGVDPKSVVCEFFKAGKCVRGDRCKYSHDLGQARKVQKRDLYTDVRDGKQADTMDQWDQAKLEEVVATKQKGKLPPTEIICKYFLDAIENSKYGWFWECPSGDDCHYRHCLPPGYVLKTKADKEREKQMAEEGEEEETLEEKIDAQRKALDLSKCTPITLELFQKWKADKVAKREAEVEQKRQAAEKKAVGSGMGVMSGRDLFRYDPTLFQDDEDAAADYDVDEDYQSSDEEEEKHYDSQAESEDDGEERKEGDKVEEAATAIDKSLFLDGDDDDLPEDEE